MTHEVPKYLQFKSAFFSASGLWGMVYGDNSSSTHGKEADEAKARAQAVKLAKEHGIEFVKKEGWPLQRKETAPLPQAHEAAERIDFCDEYLAIPTMGGIITDAPLGSKSEQRFPEEVQLRVSKRLGRLHEKGAKPHWVVVSIDGIGSAITIEEAEAHGLKEAPNWLPNLTGAPTVPGPGDLERLLNAAS